MELKWQVKTSDGRTPQARVPNQYKWDFVEYLAFQRVHAIYTHHDDHFIVTFPRIDGARAQALLDDWVAWSARSESVAVCGT